MIKLLHRYMAEYSSNIDNWNMHSNHFPTDSIQNHVLKKEKKKKMGAHNESYVTAK